jgi:DNA modification methylase
MAARITAPPRLPLTFPNGPQLTLLQGDCREVLATLPAGSVHCVITSPPYYSLRDYQTGTWEDGEPECDHVAQVQNLNVGFNERWGNSPGEKKQEHTRATQYRDLCGKCGARRVDRQIGLEGSLSDYIETLVGVFRGVWRVLRDDGTCWVNLGDAYNGSGKGGNNGETSILKKPPERQGNVPPTRNAGLKPKDLCGVPHRVAFALQADGWYLRSTIVWSKPNPMPESVTDRPTTSHEYVFLLSKRPTYFYDQEAIREPAQYGRREWSDVAGNLAGIGLNGTRGHATVSGSDPAAGRNARTVWTITPQPLAIPHFASFPEALVRPCLLAGTSAKGCCARCGAGWKRVVERGEPVRIGGNAGVSVGHAEGPMDRNGNGQWDEGHMPMVRPAVTTGWEPTCTCSAGDPVPATVLDPFAGAGTVSLVAAKHGRSSIAIELSPEYLALARERLEPWLSYAGHENGA